MEMFNEIVQVLMFVIIGDLLLLVHFSCHAVQFFVRSKEGIKLIVQYPTFCASSVAGIPHAITKISIIAPDVYFETHCKLYYLNGQDSYKCLHFSTFSQEVSQSEIDTCMTSAKSYMYLQHSMPG